VATYIKEPGDKTSRDVRPDFESEKAYHWMHLVKCAEKAGTLNTLPRKPRKGPAETSFFSQVDRRLTRQSYQMGVSFDKSGRLIRE
jgi:hypothetical protein